MGVAHLVLDGDVVGIVHNLAHTLGEAARGGRLGNGGVVVRLVALLVAHGQAPGQLNHGLDVAQGLVGLELRIVDAPYLTDAVLFH